MEGESICDTEQHKEPMDVSVLRTTLDDPHRGIQLDVYFMDVCTILTKFFLRIMVFFLSFFSNQSTLLALTSFLSYFCEHG